MFPQPRRRSYGTPRRRFHHRLRQRPGNLAAHARLRNHLVRVQQRVGVVDVAQPHHDLQIVFGEHIGHEVYLLAAHAVFAGDGAAKAEAEAHDLFAHLAASFHLPRVSSLPPTPLSSPAAYSGACPRWTAASTARKSHPPRISRAAGVTPLCVIAPTVLAASSTVL